MSKIKIPYICGLIFIILCTIFYIYKSSVPNHIKEKCPDDYGTSTAETTQYEEDFTLWTNNFYDTHPGATLGDWNKARYQFWIDNGCTEAIQRYYEAKSIDKTI